MTEIDPTGELWTHEKRLFGEKIFYLNESTTKYVITGLTPKSFETIVRICDRATGSHISIEAENWTEFVRVVSSIIDVSYSLDPGSTTVRCGVRFYFMGNGVWRLTESLHSIIIHENSLKTFMRIAKLISLHLKEYDIEDYKSSIEAIRKDTAGMTDGEILEYLYDHIVAFHEGNTGYQLRSDLICNRDMGLTKFNLEFYNRNE